MRSQIWKLLRRISEFNRDLRADTIVSNAAHSSRAHIGRLHPEPSRHSTEAGASGVNRNSHILFLAGDIVALQHLLQREVNRPVREKNLRFALRSDPARERPLAVMLSLKQSLDGNPRRLRNRPTIKVSDRNSGPGFGWKH